MRKILWDLQCFGVLNACNPGNCSSFRPKMPEKMHIDSKKRRMPWNTASVCKISCRLCVLKHGTPHLVTSGEDLESLMEANGFPVHCGRPCGATLCSFRGGRGVLFWGGKVNKIPPRQARETT